jgi:heptosyltransferase-2
MQSYKRAARSFEWWLTHRALPLGGRAKRTDAIQLDGLKRVLVVRLDEIGDVVLTGPFLRELRRNIPNASITLLVKPALKNLVELCPYVDEVLTFAPPSSRYLRSFQARSAARALAQRHFRARNFDLAIVPRWDADSYYGSMVAYLSGARNRVSYSECVTDEKRRTNVGLDRLFTHVLNQPEAKHEVEKNLELIRYLGGTTNNDRLELWLDENDEAFAREALESHGVKPADFIVAIAPGARAARRAWPISCFTELGQWLKDECGGYLMVLGGEDEIPLGNEIQHALGSTVINLVGQTTLRQAGALLQQSNLFVGNDAGPMHLAAATSRPVIEISCHPEGGAKAHPNSPARFGPWRTPHLILRPKTSRDSCLDACSASDAHCILGVYLEQVKEAVIRLSDRLH